MRPKRSISARLQRVIMLTTAAVLALTCAVFIFFEWHNSLQAEELRAVSTARITADASSAMLAFGNRTEAEKFLATFRSDQDVLNATLFDSTGQVFAQYNKFAMGRLTNAVSRPDGLYVQHEIMSVYHPVSQEGRRFGSLCLQTDLQPMIRRMVRYGWVALLIFIAALVAAYLIGQALQKSVSRPILSLAATAQSISKRRDYTVRAEAAKEGELEILTTAFNQMLEEIQRQQQALAQEKELVSITLSSIGDAVIATNEKGDVRFLNPEAERLTGWTTAEAVGQPLPSIFRIINELSRETVQNPVEKVLRDGGVVGLANHTVLISKEGKETPIDDSAAPIRQSNGPIFGVVLVFRDVSDERQAHEIQSRLAAIVEFSGDAIYTKDLNGVIRSWNGGAETLFGYHAAEIIGRPAAILIPEARLAEEERLLSQVRQNRSSGLIETVRLSKDGKHLPVSLSVSPIQDLEGNVIGASSVVHDIGQLMAAREALVREKELLATTLTSIGDAVIVTDQEGRVTFLNKEAERLTKWRSVEAASRPLHEVFKIINEETRQTVESPVDKVLRLGGVVGLANHTILIAKDGSELPIDDSAAPIRQGAGSMSGVVLVFRDFTARRNAEQALRDAHTQLADRAVHLEKLVEERTAKLREMINEMQHVSYAIVHDMRAPLRAMSTFASAVLDHLNASPNQPPEILDFCRRIVTAASRLDKLIQDSLSYTKSVLQEVPLQPVDLARLVKGLVETYPNLQSDRADIAVEDPLPVVLGEESLLTQCFSNLLGNAVKFVQPGVRPQIRIRTRSMDGLTRITIEDNGIGIPPHAQTRLFGMFQRLTAEYEGTGIGLAIVRKVTERMGGRVGAESEPGKGSRFWVELRIADSSGYSTPKMSI